VVFAIPGIAQMAAAKDPLPCKPHIATVSRKRVFLAFLMGGELVPWIRHQLY